MMINRTISNQMFQYFQEDDLGRNETYISSLPKDLVNCELKIKSDLVLSGLSYFFEAFNYLSNSELNYEEYLEFEGKEFKAGDSPIKFQLPFNVALTGERIGLNLLQKSSAISTETKRYVDKASNYNIKVLDTRKTTPGYRSLEKNAVNVAGGFNHRFGQTDVWMIKDNHKTFFGGLKEAHLFFESQNSFYTPTVVEIHNIDEIKEAVGLSLNHLMLDNFSPEEIRDALRLKTPSMTYEVSGGITLDNLDSYLIQGVDAISTSAITNPSRGVDISFKYQKA